MTDRERFKQIVKSKGWQLKEVAARWGVTPRQMSRITSKPSVLHFDAVMGLPHVIPPSK